MRDLSDFERGQIVGAHSVGIPVTKIATLSGVSRATVSEVTSAYTNRGKATSEKRNSERKATLTERDHRTLRRTAPKNYRTTTVQVNCSRIEYSS
jgi:transposase